MSDGLIVTDGYKGGRIAVLLTNIRLSWRWKRPYTLHCWADARDHETWDTFTCMRAAGHFGAHRWTPDSENVIAFTEGGR